MKVSALVVGVVAVASIGIAAVSGPHGAPPANRATVSALSTSRSVTLVPLVSPRDLLPFVTPAFAGEGVFRPSGRPVQGHSAIFTTTIRPPDNPGTVAGVAWIDPRLLRARLYSGSLSPGGFMWRYTAPISRLAAQTLVAAFNGGFLLKDSRGGYLSEGRLYSPLANGAASLVIYKDGTITVGQWGRDVAMSPRVAAVRQNLTLIVDRGAPVAGLYPNDVATWGRALNNVVDTPRSALGVRADGSLVYVEGEMNVVDLARILIRAGAQRAMVLDMNPLWTIFATYRPATATGSAAPSNGKDLTPTMVQTPARFFDIKYARDFIALSAR